ncbi:tRNA lysidine(34) synthetase TilS [Flavobacterium microcysteis]|uniref:tRNA(Ile)-lysidine synthase n=1 Tax=Flavobacterium microcysteis TaxID=2596891 RepID=A0A501QFX7_9FLAO|nr:tRNA lysidine(34) synthetase TilS [Flavobacterium microcysteis]TPD71302.1 tRNA lysidine(34) synthetase TilS [Flavobacterium microcysteis]
MLLEFQKHLAENLPFLKEKKLLLALSGGLDSMVLAHLLKESGCTVALAHCNFQLRGNESDGDEKFIRDFALENKFQLFVTRFNTESFASDNKLSIQVAARQLRYIWFYQLLEENKLDYILTAHHLDDNLETFLINLTRGTGLDGLTGIPVQNDKIVRPLLNFSREEIKNFASENKIEWREDSSNSSDKYLRNKLRHDIVPILKNLNPSFLDSFQDTLNSLQQSKSLADDASVLVYKQVVSEKDKQKHFAISELKRLPNYQAYLYEWLKPFGFKAWNDIYELIEAQSGKIILSENYRLLKDREHLILEPILEKDTAVYEIIGDEIKSPIHLKISTADQIIKPLDSNSIYVDKETLKFPLHIRKWQEGDYFCPAGIDGKKKVSKYFKDEKMSLPEKENTWLLISDHKIVWIIGKRSDQRFYATNTTQQILKIETLK